MKQDIETYLKRLKDFGYSEQQLEAVREFRESEETQHMTWEQFQFLFSHSAINKTRTLKKIRNLYLRGDKIYYLNHYNKRYEYIAVMKGEEDE